jgi:hypothetical protein
MKSYSAMAAWLGGVEFSDLEKADSFNKQI